MDETRPLPFVRWSVVDALYFCIVLVSTVGYGANLAPRSGWSRLFTIYFAMSGLVRRASGPRAQPHARARERHV